MDILSRCALPSRIPRSHKKKLESVTVSAKKDDKALKKGRVNSSIVCIPRSLLTASR